jgi:squalene synthase HpnC
VVTTRSASYTLSENATPSTPAGRGTGATVGVTPSGLVPFGLATEQDILGRASTENFKVASRLLPRATREHLLAFYGFARLVDYLGDDYPGDRLAALDWLQDQTGTALSDPAGASVHPLVARAAAAVRVVDADPKALTDLIAANRQDQVITRYDTFDSLVGYCRLSANPVGRLVLAAFGATTPERVAWSDAICTGLQLAEHWQDVLEDASAGRVYLPAEDLERFGVDVRRLSAPPPAPPALRGLMAFEVARARRILDEGAPLVASLAGRARWAVAGFWAGGQAALDAVAERGFDPLYGAPRPRPVRVAVRLNAVLRGSIDASGAG